MPLAGTIPPPKFSPEKIMFRKLGQYIQSGSLKVMFPDATTEKYGKGPPFFKLIIKEKSVLKDLIQNPLFVFGEAYADGSIELEGTLENVIRLLSLNKNLIEKFTESKTGKIVKAILGKPSSQEQRENIRHHYDLGNDFFALWLDPTMSYSCAYFHTPQDTLEQAQLQKIDHTLKKLQLKAGQTLLDIGSGWGWLIIRAAEQYRVKATGITLSEEQYEKTKERIHELGLHNLVNVYLMDYRELANLNRQFDRVVSIGMFEHVGKSELPLYMALVKRLLNEGGLSLLHTITHLDEAPPNPWIEKYIFPGGYIPSLRETVWLLPEYNFHLLDIDCLRLHYALTLDRWAENYEKNLQQIRKKYDERFIRMWRMYLRCSAASFRHSGLSIHQLLFSKGLNNQLPLNN